MSHSTILSKTNDGNRNHVEAHVRHQGFIAFCDTNLRYEKGFKAWILIGPYLVGALFLEMTIDAAHAKAATALALWAGFLLYLVLFPPAWRRILKLLSLRKAASAGSSVEMP